ncbi:hypothetical protein EDC94DRAFT_671324 [Helicostylum pulchrum]|nr:hypothetical protein EDC94DRAFT_671324 [Helicostylum pulchrum]
MLKLFIVILAKVGKTRTCVQCVGEGRFISTLESGKETVISCRACDGMGVVTTYSKCVNCGGKRHEECGIYVKIDKGITELYTIQINHCGNLMPDGSRQGDLIIEVLVDNKSANGLFKRRDDNLSITLDVDLRDAILGYLNRPVFIYLDGKPIHLPLLSGAVLKPGPKINMPGYGMPKYLDSRGLNDDLHITFNVVFPDYVNITESSDDRKVINKFFMIEKERKARENATVIDDDDDDVDDNDNDNNKKDDDDSSYSYNIILEF